MRGRRWVVVVAGIVALCGAPAAAVADPAPEYFNVPADHNAGGGIAAAPDGTIWFASNKLSAPEPSLGRLIPSQASPGTANGIATFPTPTKAGTGCCANSVTSVAYDAAANRVWFVQNDGIVGFANPGAVSPGTGAGIVDTLIPNHIALWDVAIGAGGTAWFSEESAGNVAPYPGDRIASIDAGLSVHEQDNIALQGGRVTLDPQRYDAKPEGIATDPTGKPWFAEADPGLPGYRIATTNGNGYDEYLITPCAPTAPCSGSYTGTGPTDVAVAHDGSIWFTNQLKNEVGRLDPSAHTFTNFSLPGIDAGLASGQARAIGVASDGTLWVVENGGYSYPNANAIVRIVPSQPTPTASVYHLGAGKYPGAVAADTKGNVWFTVGTDVVPSLVGRLAGVIGGSGGGGDKPLTPASVGVARIGKPSTKGASATVDQVCVGPPADRCSLVYIISANEYVAGFPGSKASASAAKAKKKPKKRKPKAVVLGMKSVTLHGGQHKRVTIKLNAKGRKLLAHAKGGKLTLFFTVTQAGAKGKPAKRLKRTKITFKLPPKHKPKQMERVAAGGRSPGGSARASQAISRR